MPKNSSNVQISNRKAKNSLFGSFSITKRKILLLLKREHELNLKTLSEKLGISKMGILKQINDLEEMGLINRKMEKRKGAGRPRLVLTPTPQASDLFPKAYASLTTFAFEFIEDQLGQKGVEQALRKRQKEVYNNYKHKVKDIDSLGERVKVLTRLRDEEGYMAELKTTSANNFELLEYNCPIFNLAEKYVQACEVERDLFEDILGTDVETSHRVVVGDRVCRFFIKNNR